MPKVEPITAKPFSSKALRECYAKGAERFGWGEAPSENRGRMRDDNGFLVGWGMGTATVSGADVCRAMRAR